MSARRVPMVLAIVAAVVAAIAVDTSDDVRTSTARIEAPSFPQPISSGAGALGSTFFCAGGTATTDGAFDQVVVIANPTESPVDATVTVVPGALDGDAEQAAAISALKRVDRQVTVGPRSRTEVQLSTVQPSPYAAAIVEVSGGDVTVEHRITGKLGTDSGPCASSASGTWYVPGGSTTKDAKQLLALFNPFPGDAVVDLSFATSDGHREPQRFRNYVVPGHQLRVIDVAAELQRHEVVATTLVATSGRIVVDRLQLFDGSEPTHPAGLAVTLAAPAPATAWVFPEGQVGDGIIETVTIYNPGRDEAVVDLEVLFDDPEANGTIEPIEVRVSGESYTQVRMNDQTRIAPGIGHSLVVRSQNGVPVVPERTITSVAPAKKLGYAPSLGSAIVSDRWVFADGRADANVVEVLALVNPSDQRVTVSVHALAQGRDLAIDGLQSVELGPHERVVLDLGTKVNRPDLPVVVQGDGPFVAERGLYQVGRIGISLALGLPSGTPISVATLAPATASGPAIGPDDGADPGDPGADG